MTPSQNKEHFLLAHFEAECEAFPPQSRRYVERLMQEAKGASNIMEIGIGPEAVSSQTFAWALAMAGRGYLYSIDINPARPTKRQRAFVDNFGVRWKVDHGDSLKYIPSSIGPEFDLLYIDGDHGLDHARGDYLNWALTVRSGGTIIFDDYPHDGVKAAVDSLGLEGEFYAYDPDSNNGFYIVRKV